MNKITNASRFLFEELVSRIQERSNAVGIAVAIVDRNGNTQYEKFFGYRDQEKKLPIDEDTIFGLVRHEILCGFIGHAAGRSRKSKSG